MISKYDVINHARGDTIWFHTTTSDRLESILKDGLKINSKPNWQSAPEPWIYLSTVPWHCQIEGQTMFEVDLAGFSENEQRSEVGWPFVDESNWDERWQLRVFKDIPAERVMKRISA